MKSSNVVMAVFSGTGNTLHAANALSDALQAGGCAVSMLPMERPEALALPEDAALGLAVPLACFSTYPTAWRFIDGLPAGKGRDVFFLASMGGVSGGMEGPIRRVVERKGYRPVAAKIVLMPSNYGNKELPEEKNRRLVAVAERAAVQYAGELLSGKGSWGAGKPLVSSFFARLAHGRMPWRGFYRAFPLQVDAEACVGCGLCAKLCPEATIEMVGDAPAKAKIGGRCQSCQRCVAICPVDAIAVPGRNYKRYRGVCPQNLTTFLGG